MRSQAEQLAIMIVFLCIVFKMLTGNDADVPPEVIRECFDRLESD